jgi:hypothetical protein
MIKNRITPEIKSRFLEAINNTEKTGNEHGFYLCLDKNKRLFPSKLQEGDSRQVKLGEPSVACSDKKIQGDFHTHNYFTLTKNKSKYVKGMSDLEIKKFIKDKFQEYKEELGIKELSVNSPSSKDLLKAIIHRCESIEEGTTCIGTDLNNTVECWSVKKDISLKNCFKALNTLYENGKEKDIVKYENWFVPLFQKESIE